MIHEKTNRNKSSLISVYLLIVRPRINEEHNRRAGVRHGAQSRFDCSKFSSYRRSYSNHNRSIRRQISRNSENMCQEWSEDEQKR
jgi:hypothetical protein